MAITGLHDDWLVLASRPPVEDHEVCLLRSSFPALPSDYLDFARMATEVELKGKGKKYLRIWSPQGCLEMDEAYGISQRMKGAIPIGDNGGGQVVFYQCGNRGDGIYRVGYGNLDADDAIFIASSLRSLLQDGEGIDTL